jgi:hypothetical protein
VACSTLSVDRSKTTNSVLPPGNVRVLRVLRVLTPRNTQPVEALCRVLGRCGCAHDVSSYQGMPYNGSRMLWHAVTPHSLLQLRTRIEPIALENDNQNAVLVKASQSNKQIIPHASRIAPSHPRTLAPLRSFFVHPCLSHRTTSGKVGKQ